MACKNNIFRISAAVCRKYDSIKNPAPIVGRDDIDRIIVVLFNDNLLGYAVVALKVDEIDTLSIVAEVDA